MLGLLVAHGPSGLACAPASAARVLLAMGLAGLGVVAALVVAGLATAGSIAKC